MPSRRPVRRSTTRAPWPGYRTSGDLTINGGPTEPSASCRVCHGSGCPSCVWPVDIRTGGWLSGSSGHRFGGYVPHPLPDDRWWHAQPDGGGLFGGLVPAVTRCTQVIVNPIVRTPWVVARDDGEPVRLPTWVVQPMLTGRSFGPSRPLYPAVRRLTGHEFWSTLVTHALWWGRGCLLYAENADGQPEAGSLRVVNPFMVGVDGWRYSIEDPETGQGLLFDEDGRIDVGGRTWVLRVMRGLPPHDGSDDFMGGVLIRHAAAFGVSVTLQTYQRDVFHTGVPSGVLKVSGPNNLTPETAQALKDTWMNAHGGDRRSVAVLNATVDFTPISWNPTDTNMTEVARVNRLDVAHAFGLPASILDAATNSMTYSNKQDERSDLVDHTTTGWGTGLMEMLTTVLPAGQSMGIDWSHYTTVTERGGHAGD